MNAHVSILDEEINKNGKMLNGFMNEIDENLNETLAEVRVTCVLGTRGAADTKACLWSISRNMLLFGENYAMGTCCPDQNPALVIDASSRTDARHTSSMPIIHPTAKHKAEISTRISIMSKRDGPTNTATKNSCRGFVKPCCTTRILLARDTTQKDL
ncbi:hypothetical protein E2C01_000039 [Portunus trituberculatus]|uniref:Uncharacterized protein n=1 Tax=Portunus trituberculatus TaxID=210409 RepID=A0A5B7CDK0_PORTR|nr:hypothetical protein [Portunus trituberculatus]